MQSDNYATSVGKRGAVINLGVQTKWYGDERDCIKGVALSLLLKLTKNTKEYWASSMERALVLF